MNEPAVIRLAIESDTLSGQQKYNAQHTLAILESRIPKWHSIETAPKDGTELLLFQQGVGCGVSWWGYDEDNQEKGWFRFSPTHWQPLPNPPTEAN